MTTQAQIRARRARRRLIAWSPLVAVLIAGCVGVALMVIALEVMGA